MTFTQTHYNALAEAIALGATEVTYGDKTVKYRSLAEMMALLDRMATDLGLNTGEIKVTVPIVDRGLNTAD
jgi:hypothetical protein